MTDLTQGTFPSMMQDPFADESTQPFWDAANEGRLTAPRCTVCGTFVLPPQAFEWVDLPGTGTIYTYTVVRHPLAPQLAAVVPYVSGVIELDGTQGAGARLLLNITDADPDTVRLGDQAQIWFDQVSETFPLPRARMA